MFAGGAARPSAPPPADGHAPGGAGLLKGAPGLQQHHRLLLGVWLAVAQAAEGSLVHAPRARLALRRARLAALFRLRLCQPLRRHVLALVLFRRHGQHRKRRRLKLGIGQPHLQQALNRRR